MQLDERIRRLRDAVTGRNGRQVEVTPDGEVREVRQDADGPDEVAERPAKSTKLAPRTFGA